jgi:hypothetical protein
MSHVEYTTHPVTLMMMIAHNYGRGVRRSMPVLVLQRYQCIIEAEQQRQKQSSSHRVANAAEREHASAVEEGHHHLSA